MKVTDEKCDCVNVCGDAPRLTTRGVPGCKLYRQAKKRVEDDDWLVRGLKQIATDKNTPAVEAKIITAAAKRLEELTRRST